MIAVGEVHQRSEVKGAMMVVKGKEKKGSGASSSRDASKSMKELLEGALRGGKL